jgi:dihydroflavonol-4-reductase
MKVFLTGGTGFIGRHLTRALLTKGWDVTALVRRPDSVGAAELTQMGARCIPGDITICESLRAGMAGAEVVIHNAGHYEFGVDAAGRQRMQAANVEGIRNVLEVALELSVPRSLYVSTVTALGDSGPESRDETFERNAPFQTFYERTKAEAHAIACEYRQRGLPLVIACPNAVVGPNDHSVIGYFLRMYINRLLPPLSTCPGALKGLVEVHDVAAGLALAAEKGRPGETYFLSGEPQSQADMLAEWARYPGGFKRRAWLHRSIVAPMLETLKPLERRAGLPAFMSAETARSISIHANYSSVKAQEELGWRFCPASEMWRNIILGELELLRRRKKRDLVSRLNPLPANELEPSGSFGF